MCVYTIGAGIVNLLSFEQRGGVLVFFVNGSTGTFDTLYRYHFNIKYKCQQYFLSQTLKNKCHLCSLLYIEYKYQFFYLVVRGHCCLLTTCCVRS